MVMQTNNTTRKKGTGPRGVAPYITGQFFKINELLALPFINLI
jgi:hypothetical protein